MTESIIGAAIAVHRDLGPGYVEKIYENALCIELEARGHEAERQITVNVEYRGRLVGQHRIDVLVDGGVVLELKSVDALASVHSAQLRSTLKAAGRRVGLPLNFNQPTLKQGLQRVIC